MGLLINSSRRFLAFALAIVNLYHPGAPSAFAAAQPVGSDPAPLVSPADEQTKARIEKAYGNLPLRFEENVGQIDSRVRFVSRAPGYSLFLTRTETVMRLHPTNRGEQPEAMLQMKLVGAGAAPMFEGLDALSGKTNYLIGNDSREWRRNVTSYARVRSRNVYPGIDVIYYGNQRQLEYDFVLAPGADPGAIRLRFDGMKRMSIDPQGDLILHTGAGDVRQRKPVIYQEIDGRRREVAGGYQLKGKRQVGFQLAGYDRSRPLIIDPTIDYLSYIGGSDLDWAAGVAVDKDGNAYLVGVTSSQFNFPTVNALQPTFGGVQPPLTPYDAFVTKINRDGTALIFSTFFGGHGYDEGHAIVIGKDGSVYMAGSTTSYDFPVKNAIQPSFADETPDFNPPDGFAARLTPDGSALIFSTYLGGGDLDSAEDVAVDLAGNLYLVGVTRSTNFPVKNPLQAALAGNSDAFISKIKADGSELMYSTFLGGSGQDAYFFMGVKIAVDRFGAAYIAGNTNSTDFPLVHPLQAANAGGWDSFIAKLTARGDAIVYSTYLGGSGDESGIDITVDLAGNAYVTGSTDSTDYPTANPLQPTYGGGRGDAFVSKLNRTGASLCYSTYLGGADNDLGNSLTVDPLGRVYVAGQTYSTDFPTWNAFAPRPDTRTQAGDGFVASLNARGARLLFSSYLGGQSADALFAIALDLKGAVYVAGGSASNDLPVAAGAFQPTFRGPNIPFPFSEGFVAKISNRLSLNQAEQAEAEQAEDDAFLRSQGCSCVNQ